MAHEGRLLDLLVFNCKTGTVRPVAFTPNSGWGGKGLLGATITFDSFDASEEHFIHVLDVHAASPSAVAGLEPYTDYLLGTRGTPVARPATHRTI